MLIRQLANQLRDNSVGLRDVLHDLHALGTHGFFTYSGHGNPVWKERVEDNSADFAHGNHVRCKADPLFAGTLHCGLHFHCCHPWESGEAESRRTSRISRML